MAVDGTGTETGGPKAQGDGEGGGCLAEGPETGVDSEIGESLDMSRWYGECNCRLPSIGRIDGVRLKGDAKE